MMERRRILRPEAAKKLTLAKLVFWLAVAFAFVMAAMPYPPEFPGGPSDKVQHVIAFLVLAALGLWAYPRSPKRLLLVGLAAFGALIELVQSIPALNRDSDPTDWMADTLAAATVLTLVALWRLAKER
ncbi:MAG: VanZ family protein [Alphaproteobacteria bacterium]